MHASKTKHPALSYLCELQICLCSTVWSRHIHTQSLPGEYLLDREQRNATNVWLTCGENIQKKQFGPCCVAASSAAPMKNLGRSRSKLLHVQSTTYVRARCCINLYHMKWTNAFIYCILQQSLATCSITVQAAIQLGCQGQTLLAISVVTWP